MANKTIMEKQLLYMEFLNRENDLQNFYYDEAVLQYELLRVGNPKAVKEGSRLFCPDMNGHLSNDPLQHYQYLFVAAITLVQHCINYRVISTRYPCQHCVVISQRWNPIASFFRLVLTRISGTDYFDINATLY